MSVKTITKDNFDSEVMNSDKPVLLDFWASWCGPCRMVAPILEDISNEVTTAVVGKINIDEQPELAKNFKVMSIPTLVVIKDGKIINTAVGVRPKADIIKMLEA
ncbi:MAG TPA: thioredoxin [Clostridiales bacterium]|mgnify:CR=1 FL=1|jgi:thioredoxin 1|nr:thioredoxin [Clostridiales bacterium]HBR08331.1 thioredoxin [Clostridiales bacterium]